MLVLINKIVVLSSLLVFGTSAGPSDVTFKNVTVRGYSMFTYKFNVTIIESNTLKNHLPKRPFDKIEIVNSELPVLYEDSITDIDNLDELILDHDQINEIQPGTFKNVPLRKLVITNNNIEELKSGVFNNLDIATLDLSRNKIAKIAASAFDDMPDLLNINLADNQIRHWNEKWFANTPLLTRVSLQNNLIEKIQANAFPNLKGVKQYGSVSLTINIILSHNKISSVDKRAFADLKKINNLWLDNNQITNWHEDTLSPNNEAIELKELRLNENKLKCLNGDLAKIFLADTTWLDGNPWDCECVKTLKKWTENNPAKNVMMFYSHMTCEADRIQKKMDDLKNYLNKLKKNREQEKNAITESPIETME